jgi:branched-chain amino acid transport system substrate-binding protein
VSERRRSPISASDRRRPRRIGWLALSLGVAAAVVPARADEPYKINAILPLTGQASFLGKEEQVTLQIAEKYVNRTGGIKGRPVQFVFYDDTSNPQVAVQLVRQVSAEKPAVILGSSLVAVCNAMAPLMSQGPVDYCFSPGVHPAAGSYAFSASVSTHDLQKALFRYFREKGWKRIAIMTSSDATGQDAERGIDETLGQPEYKDAGLTLVERAHFNTTDVSVAAQIETVKAANPDAFVAWSTGTPIATIFKGILQAGLDVPTATTDGNMTFAQMTNYADFLPKQLYIPAAEWPPHEGLAKLDPAIETAQQDFYAEFKAAGVEPDVAASLAWGPAMLVTQALRQLGTDATATQIRDYLASLKGSPGIDGFFDFPATPQRGLDDRNAVVTRWEPAKHAWVVLSEPGGMPLK